MIRAQLPTLEGDAFVVDGASFCIDYFHRSTADELCIRKPTDLIEAYARLIELGGPETIVELGIAGGGSTALLALLAAPRKLVAVELDPDPISGLTEFIHARGLANRVRPFYGVNQADRDRLTEIVEQEFESGPIDLVIDDASHLLEETRASFEILFPRLRPGGLYVIEDWSAHHLYADAVAETAAVDAADPSPRDRPTLDRLGKLLHADQPERFEPLTRLLVELILARARSGEAVAEISVDESWITVRRGPGELDRKSFRVADLYTDHFRLVT